MVSQHEALAKLQRYASKVDDQEYTEGIQPDEEEVYANQLQKSLQSLQNQVQEHEKRLEKASNRVHA